MAQPIRNKVNQLEEQELIEIANHRAGSNLFFGWQRGQMNRGVAIAGVVLEPGDAVLYTAAIGSAVKVWSPLVIQTLIFILPDTHIDPDDISEEL